MLAAEEREGSEDGKFAACTQLCFQRYLLYRTHPAYTFDHDTSMSYLKHNPFEPTLRPLVKETSCVH